MTLDAASIVRIKLLNYILGSRITPRASEFPFQLLDTGYIADAGNHCPHCNDGSAVSLLYTVSGAGRIGQSRGQLELYPQSCCMLKSRKCRDCGAVSPEEPWSYYYVRFTGTGLQAYAPYLLGKPHCLYPGKPKRLTEIFHTLQKKDSASPLLACSRNSLLITELLDMLLESRYKLTSMVQPKDGANPEVLAPAYEYIRKNYASPLTVEDLARECCLSKYYFLRQFKESSGESPYQYLTRHRIDVARRLLTDTDLSVSAVASMVGYANYGNFLVHFKKLVNMTPAQYRSAGNNPAAG